MTTPTTLQKKLSPNEAREILWRQGSLLWLLDVNQQVLYKMYKTVQEKILVWNLARGSGKSFLLCVLAIEECLKNPKALVKYACAKQKDARQIIQPLLRDILETCPKDIKPVWSMAEGAYKFPNGAQIQLSGLDAGKAESLRGGSSVLGIVDEAGAKGLKDLKYIVNSIFLPAVTRTKNIDGKIILASTPPLSEKHPFVHFLRRADLRGASLTRTVYTNPRMTPEMIRKLIDEYGGEDTPEWRREYLCEIIRDENDAVIPEFTEQKAAKIIKTWPRPPFIDSYTAMDLGMKDLTVVLFAYFDFRANKVIIEDEYVVNGAKFTTQVLADNIKKKEAELYTDPFTGEFMPPFKRVSDNNLIVINDLWQLHSLQFIPTKKDDADAALNNLRMMIDAEQIIINPKCVTLIAHLKEATWNKARTSFDRSSDNFHADAIDSAKYLIRNVNFQKNPYPAHYNQPRGDSYYQHNTKALATGNGAAIAKMLNIKKR